MADPTVSQILLKGGTILQHDMNDNIVVLRSHDLLIKNDTIAEIGRDLEAHPGMVVIDCRDAVISPGFIDTHHHVWQTQLKGRHSDDTLLDYTAKGNWQPFNYTASDVFWGQIGGLMEAIDGGTTCIVDHAHMTYTPNHGFAGFAATASAKIRSIYCLSIIPRLRKWDSEIVPEPQVLPDWFFPLLQDLQQLTQKSNGRISMGLGFDSYDLCRNDVVRIFERSRRIGTKRITSHWRRNNIAGMKYSLPKLLQDYGLLQSDIILSHACGSTDQELKLLRDAGAFVATTPATESQMAHGEIVGFRDDVLGSIGADCHSSNPASILHAMQVGLAVSRSSRNSELLARGKFPAKVEPTTQHAFNLATIHGARAVGLADEIGSLIEGKAADIIVIRGNTPTMCCAFDHDPVAAVVRHASVRDIDTVIVGGSILKANGTLTKVSLEGPQQWDGYESVKTVFGDQDLSWEGVAQELRSTRLGIQKRTVMCNEKAAKDKILEMWGANIAEDVLE